MITKEDFRQAALSTGLLSAEQVDLAWDFHLFEGRKRHPAEVAVSLGLMAEENAKLLTDRANESHSEMKARRRQEPAYADPAAVPKGPALAHSRGIGRGAWGAQGAQPPGAGQPPQGFGGAGQPPQGLGGGGQPPQGFGGQPPQAGLGAGGGFAQAAPAGQVAASAPSPNQAPLGGGGFAIPSPGTSAKRARPAGAASSGALGRLVRHAIEARASDLYIHSSVVPFMRVHGQLESGFAAVLEHAQIMDELQDLLSTPQWEQLAQQGEVNLCVTYQMGFRLRINVLRGKNGVGLSMRLIPPDVRSLGELRIPMAAAGLTNYHQGLVVVGGPASAGKSATMAALVQRMAEHRKVHIITIEDPIEYVYKPNNSTITQRNIGLHTQSYATALKAALREDPDVIIVGELNDQETIRTALTASETGHLVIGSMTAWDVEGTIVRLLDAFEEEEEQVRGLVADTLRGVLVQQLVRTTRGELAPVMELMFNNSAVGNCIRKRKLHQISSLIHAGKQQKMISWEDSVRELKNKGHLSPQDETRIIHEVKRMSLQAEANKPQGRDA